MGRPSRKAPFKETEVLSRSFDGGRTRARTLDPLIKSQLLYQLSYAPIETWALEPKSARH
jgi:hypothetical protein